MYCISINHKNTIAKVREQFALNEKEQSLLYELVKENENVDACVCLMTCNRSEIYFSGSEEAYAAIIELLNKIKNIDTKTYRKLLMRYEGRTAITHLYRVICGLDSAVLGEVEIIRQVKQAYSFAHANEMTDAEINIIFQGALQLAKEMADKTMMTRLPVSVGTLTTGAALEFCREIENPHILIVGATGEIGTIVMKDILDAGQNADIIGTSRKHGIDDIEFMNTVRTKCVHYDERYDYIEWADVIISATKSPHYTFLSEEVKKHLIESDKKLLFIDLAIPRDVDEEIDSIPNCIVRNIDYIKKLAVENNEKKLSEAKKVGLVISEKTKEMEKTLLLRNFIEKDSKRMQLLKDKSAAWMIYKLRDYMDIDAFKQVLDAFEN